MTATSEHSVLKAFVSILICFFAALLIAYVSTNLQDRFGNREETIQIHYAMITGEGFYFDGNEVSLPNFYGRVLTPYIMKGLAQTGLSDSQAFLLTRIVTAFLAVLCFSLAAGGFASPEKNVMATGAITLLMLCFIRAPWEHMADFLDIALFALYIFICFKMLRHRLQFWVFSFIIASIAALNRESAAFFGIIAFFVTAFEDTDLRRRVIDVVASGFLCLQGYAVNTLSRIMHGGMETMGNQTFTLGENFALIPQLFLPRPFTWRDFLIAGIVFSLVPLTIQIKKLNRFYMLLFLSSLAIFIVSILFGKINEPRVFAPSFVIWLILIVRSQLLDEGMNQTKEC